MSTRLTRRYRIEAAHQLTGMREGHKCARVHGHNYGLAFVVEAGAMSNGMVLDAEALDAIVGPVLALLDHRLLNEAAPGDLSFATMRAQPTAENIATCLWRRLAGEVSRAHPGVRLVSVAVQENEDLTAECVVP